MDHIDVFSIVQAKSGKSGVPGWRGGRGSAVRLTRPSAKELVVKGRSLIYFAGAHMVNGLVLLCLANSGVIDRAIYECAGYLHYSFLKYPVCGGTSPT